MLASAAHALFPTLLAAFVLGLLGAASGPFLARFAAQRTLAQPLALALEDEIVLLRGVLQDVRRLPYLTSLTGRDFAAGANGRIWEALIGCSPECAGVAEDASEQECEERGQTLVARRDDYLLQVQAQLLAGPAPVGDTERLAELLEPATVELDDAAVVEAGHCVLASGMDRNRLSGVGLVLPTSTPDSSDPAHPPLHRVHVPASRARQVGAAIVASVTAAAAPGFAVAAGFHGLAAGLAVASVLALTALSIVIALVDLDTFYVDLHTFVGGGALAWLLAVAAAGVEGSWGRLTAGVLIVAGTALVFEAGNKLYKLVRGQDGQGFGDTLIVLATAGVPPALAGSWELGYYSVMVGMVVGVLGWVVGFARGKLTRTTPFAFGPYLAAGWVLAWLGVVATGVTL